MTALEACFNWNAGSDDADVRRIGGNELKHAANSDKLMDREHKDLWY